MIPSNIKDLINALIEKTIQKKAIWDKTSRPNEFKLNFEKGAVTTDFWGDEDGDSVDFAIYNSFGDRIDRSVANRGEPDFQLMANLHNTAMREFYKVDETISSFFVEVNEDKSIGKREIEESPDLPF
ncbi:MAG: hypothetical protein QM535_22300 [Limnohabitans sp.]|nr:hypothetical protein [Limnohabitans sp.]